MGLFFAFNVLHPEDEGVSPKSITVHRDDLLRYMQYKAKAFDGTEINAKFAGLTGPELAKLIADYVEEEALFREAKSLGLDQNDYIERLRLIQKLKFITGGIIEDSAPSTEKDVAAYFEAHKNSYAVPAQITFTHVYFSNDRNGAQKADALARQALKQLNAGHVPFYKAPAYGERFPYNVNYVQKDATLVTSHFGTEMAKALFALTPDENVWYGPFHSALGAHLVLVTAATNAYVPALADIHDRVAADARRVLQNENMNKAIDSIVAKYDVRLSDDLPHPARGPAP